MSETTAALLGFGSELKLRTSTGPDVYTKAGQQNKVTPYGVKVDKIDATHEESPGAFKEYIAGLIDAGEVAVELHYIPGGSVEAMIMGQLGLVGTWRTVFPSGAYVQYTALVTDFSPDAPLDGKMVANLKLQISGQITVQAATAPVNTLEPAIHGSDATPSSGDTLTAGNGLWSNEPTSFTYQWKKDGVNIGGATAKTYTVVSGDSTHVITVTVTAANSAGNASATSIGATIS